MIHLHSILRYLVLLFTLVVALQSLMGLMGKKEFAKGNKMTALFMMISCDLQLLVGLALLFMNGHLQSLSTPGAMSNKGVRFFALEHPLAMIIGIVLVHIGYSIAKKDIPSPKKFNKLLWFSAIAFLLFVSQTPWPGKAIVGRPLFPGMSVSQ